MDIAAASIIMHQSQLQQSAGIAVMKLAMQTEQTGMAQITRILAADTNVQAAAQPQLGANLDVTA